MASFDLGFGRTTIAKDETTELDSSNRKGAFHCNLLIGPAVGFYLNDIVQFMGTFGFSWMITDNYYYKLPGENDSFILNGCGIGMDLQAKFFPNERFSPIAGYRVTWNWNKEYTLKFKTSSTTTTTTSKADSAYTSCGTIYIGASYNF